MIDQMTEDERILAVVEADVALKKAIPLGKTNFYIAEDVWTMTMKPIPLVGWLDDKGNVCEAKLIGTPIEGDTMACLTCVLGLTEVFNLIVFKDKYQSPEVVIENPVN